MSINRLRSVELIEQIILKCRSCNSNVTARKLEVSYAANQTRKHSTFLMTDVLYCNKCDKGYVLSAFQKIMDSNNRSWIIQSQVSSAAPKLPALSRAAASAPSVNRQTPNKIKLDFIDLVLADHEEMCRKCAVVLVKCQVDLKITKNNHSDYIPCTAWHCTACRQWMLRHDHYNHLQSNNRPYTIQVKKPDSIWQASNNKKQKTRQNIWTKLKQSV